MGPTQCQGRNICHAMEPKLRIQSNSSAEGQSSSSTFRRLHYDIFLSFRGPDTRYSFIGHLRKGLMRGGYLVFYDDQGIQSGKEIRAELPKAIQDSKSSIVVLSKDYASSKWCLNELVEIMKRHTLDGHHVMPVFYHVNPRDVRKQKNRFADPFVKHERTFKEEIVKDWKEALTKIGGLKGIIVEEKIEEAEVIQEIVKKIGEFIGTGKYQFLTSELVGEGFERAKDEIWSLLIKDDVEKIGVYGMGGVGKTTLMTHIYNQLQERSDSSPPSYWVTVSQDFSIYRLQDGIAKAINMDISKEDDLKRRAAKINQELMRKQKFILVMDDLWDDFDTKDVGLRVGPKGCKLVFTTRSNEICRKMGCKKNTVKVEPLLEEEARELFKKEIENYDIDDEELAQAIVKECAGLPLAIKVMAKSLKEKDDITEWRHALAQLRDSKFTKDDDMEQKVFAVLRSSYASLKDKSLQECFLYCALFPEDAQIDREKLIELLICEGIIEEGKSRLEEVDKGHVMLNKLESLCLLEGRFGQFVEMHDLIRDVALQELRDNKSVVMVEAGKQLRALPDVGKWRKNLYRASFINNHIENIPSGHSPSCPDLLTLLLCGNSRLEYIGGSFLEKLNGLKVLDLSRTGIKELPSSISNLVKLTGLFLRNCHNLRHVPSLAKLQELKALDFHGAGLKEVPQGMALLHNLRYLSMWAPLKVFPAGILPKLSRLQFLRLNQKSLVRGEEIGGLRNLEVLDCGFQDFVGFNRYLQFQKHEKPLAISRIFVNCSDANLRYPKGKRVNMWGCDISKQFDKLPKGIEELVLDGCKGPKSLVPLSNATELKMIHIADSDGIECLVPSSSSSGSSVDDTLESLCFPVKINTPWFLPSYGSTLIHLKELVVRGCHGMKRLLPPGLLQNLKNLEYLDIRECEGMEEIYASNEENCNNNITSEFSLPKLRILRLNDLPRLTSICDGSLICQFLEELEIVRCEMLEKIPVAPPLPSVQLRLPKLRILCLCDLQRLRSICDGSLICHSLQEIEVFGCPKLEKIPVAPLPPCLVRGSFGSRELLEQFKRDHPSVKDILQHVEHRFQLERCPDANHRARGSFASRELVEQFERDHPNVMDILQYVVPDYGRWTIGGQFGWEHPSPTAHDSFDKEWFADTYLHPGGHLPSFEFGSYLSSSPEHWISTVAPGTQVFLLLLFYFLLFLAGNVRLFYQILALPI